MAAPTVTLDTPHPARLGGTQFGILSGQVDIESYDTAHPAVAAIVGQFKTSGALRVTCNGISEHGYLVAWDTTTHSFLAYAPGGTIAAPTITTVTNAGTAVGATIFENAGTLTQTAGVTGIVGVQAPAFTGGVAGEVSAATDVGFVDFIAVGHIGL